jgi:branched-subunit amino acid aminotransferase/4-amino-4-deoxychorismate lyase
MTEGARSNIFAVREDEILTPPADRVLSGITRDIVIRLASDAGYRLCETPLYLNHVSEYDEFFITSTSMHVMPVVRIDQAGVGTEQVGPVTGDLLKRFEEYHRQYFDRVRAAPARI